MNREKMAQFISSLRKEKNLMQQDLAEIFNVSPQAVSKWEKGDSIPDIEILEKLSSFYKVTIEEILNGERKESLDEKIVRDKTKNGENRLNVLNFISGICLIIFTIVLFFLPFLNVSVGAFNVSTSGYNIIFSSNFLSVNFVILLNYLSYIALGVIEIILSFNIENENLNKAKHILMNSSSFLSVTCLIVILMFGNTILIGIILFSILNIVYFILNLTIKEFKVQLKLCDKNLGIKILYLSIIFVLLIIPSIPSIITTINFIVIIVLIGILLVNTFKLLSNLWWYILSLALLIFTNIILILSHSSLICAIVALIVFIIFVPINLAINKNLEKKVK